MSKVILDTSAFLAFANREPGAEKVRPRLREAVVSAVNATEILQKLVAKKMTLVKAEEYLKGFVSDITPFGLEQAALTAALHTQTRPFGLSLEDRACLALGIHLGLPIMTADQDWAKLDIGVNIELIRVFPRKFLSLNSRSPASLSRPIRLSDFSLGKTDQYQAFARMASG